MLLSIQLEKHFARSCGTTFHLSTDSDKGLGGDVYWSLQSEMED